ncbi:hypothetical protein K466DRAFT_473851, partial [Polyporus arcularius HHB13444]
RRWTSPVYAFYKPKVTIVKKSATKIGHVFTCAKPGCKFQSTRYLDTKDSTSTSNLRDHVKACWGPEILAAAEEAKTQANARPMVEAFGRSGTITKIFKRIGKGKVSYSIRQHTSTETRAWIVRWVAENKRPYQIVGDRAFLQLMKTGRPEYKIPSPSTVSRDVRRVFAKCRGRIARMLRNFDGDLSFTMDAWTSPNHKALVAIAVHLHHEGTPLSFILDVVEVAE